MLRNWDETAMFKILLKYEKDSEHFGVDFENIKGNTGDEEKGEMLGVFDQVRNHVREMMRIRGWDVECCDRPIGYVVISKSNYEINISPGAREVLSQ